MTEINKMKFEEALENLEKNAHNIKNEQLSLEDAVNAYEEGIKYYNRCKEILDDAKQKIETVSR